MFILKSSFYCALFALLTGCASSGNTNLDYKIDSLDVTFFDSSIFDDNLQSTLERAPDEVTITMPCQFNLNEDIQTLERSIESKGTNVVRLDNVMDIPVDNNAPFNQDQSKGVWVAEGPHLMLLLPESLMKDLPRDPYAGGPYVMFEGSDFVHVMVPLEVTQPLK